MNKTKIEWCTRTWNPVTGCYHDCPYCYAKKIANRFRNKNNDSTIKFLGNCLTVQIPERRKEPYPYGFIPTLHEYRLDEPSVEKYPQNVFVCSMADLFGKWVPDKWVDEVFKACEKAPHHRYLFLTKNIDGYARLFRKVIPTNFWLGFSATEYDKAMQYKHLGYWKNQMFVSAEPLLKPFNDFNTNLFEWVIIGAETGNRKGKIIPERAWIEDIVSECQKNNTPVFLKNSLAKIWGAPLIQEYPWETAKNRGEKV